MDSDKSADAAVPVARYGAALTCIGSKQVLLTATLTYMTAPFSYDCVYGEATRELAVISQLHPDRRIASSILVYNLCKSAPVTATLAVSLQTATGLMGEPEDQNCSRRSQLYKTAA